MSKDTRPIEVGDRFETLDGRDAGRVVEVVEALGLNPSAAAHIARLRSSEEVSDHVARVRERKTFYRVSTESHPKNPDAIGNVSRVSERTIRLKYQRISR